MILFIRKTNENCGNHNENYIGEVLLKGGKQPQNKQALYTTESHTGSTSRKVSPKLSTCIKQEEPEKNSLMKKTIPCSKCIILSMNVC